MATLSGRIMNIKNSIETKLQLLRSHFRKITKENHMHNFAKGSESHFKLTVVSDEFTGRMLIERHRMINNILTGKLSYFIHALVLNTITIEEWFEKNGIPNNSPPCLGGLISKQFWNNNALKNIQIDYFLC